ncbi:MAG: phospholipid-binding protein family [Myxococcales bacterium]|nr:phospholipid-binding protein family [Myxococcales bacterium]
MRTLALVLMAMAMGCRTSDPPGGSQDLSTDTRDLTITDDLAGASRADLANSTGAMSLTSTAFAEGGAIPLAQSWNQCSPVGNNNNPPLKIAGVPAGTQSLAILVEDNDVVFAHWGAWDLPATMTTVAEGSSKTATYPQAFSDFGSKGYQGPCPPAGGTGHSYKFAVYALDVATLGKPDGTAYADVVTAMAGHIKAQATLNARYAR